MIKSNLTFLAIPGILAISTASVRSETDLQETARILQQAQQSRTDSQRLNDAQANHASAEIAAQLMAQAKATDGDLKPTAKIQGAGEKLKQVMSTASPEAKMLIAQSNDTGRSTAPTASQAVPKEQVTMVDLSKAKPQPLRPTSLETDDKAKAAKNMTVITASGAAFFDSKTSIGVFTEDVVVKDPRFHITCDTLEVFMKDQKAKEQANASGNAEAKTTKTASGGGNMDNADIIRAIAKGRKVVIQKMNEDGKLQIGICRHATYEASTGDIILTDFPQVQSDARSVTATERNTVIILKNNGQFDVKGAHTTVLGKPQEDNRNRGQDAPPNPTGN